MAIVYQTTSATAAGDVITLTSGTELTIAPGVFVGSEIEDGVQGQGAVHDVQVYGVVSGGNNGIELGIDGTSDGNSTVRVMDEGSVYGSNVGIQFIGPGNSVVNDGSIYGGIGVSINSFSGSLGVSTVINRGLISGSFGIISSDESTKVTNYGTIEATVGVSVVLSGTNDAVINRGFITGNGILGAGNVALGAGNDLYDGREGRIDSIIFGGEGSDKLYAGAGDNEIQGEAGNDTLIGGAGADVLNGGTGTDRVSYVSASGGVTVNLSKPGLNTGDARGDTYSSIEEVAGSRFDDNLTGNTANNWILGVEGDDVLNGGLGNDKLTGGDGNDAFIFNTALNASTNVDSIGDFNVADDVIRIDNAVFTGPSTGTLASAAFRANTTGNAADSSDRIIYETDTGRLFFDADGNGVGVKIQFATLDAGLGLTNSDFVVI